MRISRADLHVHSWHSTRNGDLPFLKSRDCYSPPESVYRVAKARGMDFVTITDHDSIDGCLEYLERHPGSTDFFVSEEVSCLFPGTDIHVHIGVYGMTEALHHDLQPLRRDVFDVTARLREAGVFFVLNHLLHFYRRQIPLADYLRLLDGVPAIESRNGTMLPAHNALVDRIAARRGGSLGLVGGSDAHTLRRIGRTWTAAPGETVAEFLASLHARRSSTDGVHGGTACVAADAYGVIASYVGSLLGRGPRDHRPVHRAACLAFSLVSLPGQFLPAAIVANGKRHEAREVRLAAAALASWLDDADTGRDRVAAGSCA